MPSEETHKTKVRDSYFPRCAYLPGKKVINAE